MTTATETMPEMPTLFDFALTPDNYHSLEAGRLFMSNSQYGDWMYCPADAHDKHVKGRDEGEEKDYLIGGRYAHAKYLQPDTIPKILERHPEIMTRPSLTHDQLKDLAADHDLDMTGALSTKAKVIARLEENDIEIPVLERKFTTGYSWLPKTLARFESQPAFMESIAQGEHEIIITFELNGVTWKAMLDNVRHDDTQFDDLKFMRDFKDQWHPPLKRYVSWFESARYDIQMGLYRYGTGQAFGEMYTPNIFAASKQAPADVDWVQFRDKEWPYLDRVVDMVAETLPQVMAWKNGDEEPPNCNKPECKFCCETKVLTVPKVPVPINEFYL